MRLGLVSTGLLTGVALTMWLVALMFDESLWMTPWSPSSLVVTPLVIRNVPRIGVVGDIAFHSSCGDGPKPPSDAILYTTRAPPAEVARAIHDYFVERGYAASAFSESTWELRGRGGELVSISIAESGGSIDDPHAGVEVRLFM